MNAFGHLRRRQWRSLGEKLAHPIGFILQGEGTRDGVQSELIRQQFGRFLYCCSQGRAGRGLVRTIVTTPLMIGESEWVEPLVQTSDPQANAPLLVDYAIRGPHNPLVAVDPIIGWGLVQPMNFSILTLRRRQALRDHSSSGIKRCGETAMRIQI